MSAAEDVAARAVANMDGLLECDRASEGDEACARQLVARLGRRAFRRPLSSEEQSVLESVYSTLSAELSFEEAITAVLEVMLQSPAFLYRPEIVVDPSEPVMRLDGYQLATRLAYTFWSTTPDETLLNAAERGELDTDDAIAEQARRLLGHERAEPAIQGFFHHLLELDSLQGLTKAAEVYPTFDEGIAGLMQQETEAFVRAVMIAPEGDRRWTTLLSADWSMMNAELASYYGLSGPSGEAFERVSLDSAHHAGLLTHGSVLAPRARTYETSPIHRGMFIRGTILCGTVPDVPENLDVDPPDPDPTLTTRQRLTEHRDNEECSSCHAQIDPLGFAFEHFDGAGRFRADENGLPIDASGELTGVDTAGHFDGAVSMADRILGSDDAQLCFAKRYFAYAQGRAVQRTDDCSLVRLLERFRESDYDVRELMVALTQTDAFLYRVVDQDAVMGETL